MNLAFEIIKKEEPSVTFYSMNKCPHCEKAEPNFNEASKHSTIPMSIVERTTVKGIEGARAYGIRSYPTIVGTKSNGERHEYFGDRSKSSFENFSKFIAN